MNQQTYVGIHDAPDIKQKYTTAGSEVMGHEDVPSIAFCTRGHLGSLKSRWRISTSARFYGVFYGASFEPGVKSLQNIFLCETSYTPVI